MYPCSAPRHSLDVEGTSNLLAVGSGESTRPNLREQTRVHGRPLRELRLVVARARESGRLLVR